MNNIDYNLLNVDFLNAKSGWIYFLISGDQKEWKIHASDWLDPFPELIISLENIIEGHVDCSLYIDEEGSGTTLNYQKLDDEYCNFSLVLTDAFEKQHTILNLKISIYNLISEFYLKLREFAESEKYDKFEWESETMGERLISISENKNFNSLVDDLMSLNGNELQNIFFQADPGYVVSFPNAIDFSESINLFVEDAFNQTMTLNTPKIELPYYNVQVCDNYDSLTIPERFKELIKMLDEPTQGYSGQKLIERKSIKIENWL